MKYATLLSVLVFAGCSGDIVGDGGGDDDGNVPGPGDEPPPVDPTSPPLGTIDRSDEGPVGPAPMRRLNRREYNNTVRDLLNDTSRPADGWPAESALTGFDTDVSGQGSTAQELEQFLAAAELVARNANQATVLGCDPATGDACALSFIDRFAARAYRRPATADQKMRLKTVFDFGRRTDFASGVRLVMEAVLQSPFFLYRYELGEKPTAGAVRVALTPHEMASRLSYFLNGTMPDDPLRAVADSGELRTLATMEAQARRLLAKPDARTILAAFHHQWLELDRLEGLTKDPKLFPAYGPRMAASLEAGTRAFVQNLYLERGDGTVDELLTAPYAYLDATTASIYGVTSTSTTVKKTTLTQPRAGILTDGAVMAALAGATETSPIARGMFVRGHLLCQPIAAPPNDVPPLLPNPNLTTRERLSMHRANPACAGCHNLLDPIGFGFENYDPIGRWRTTENGKPVDASGILGGTSKSDGPFSGVVELAGRLAKAPEARRCLSESWMTFALGRQIGENDTRTVTGLGDWLDTGGKLREFLVGMARSNAFRYRPLLATK